MSLVVSYTAQYLIFVVMAIAVIVTIFSSKTVRNRTIVLAVISLLIAFAATIIAGKLYYDPRPFVVNHTPPLFPYRPDNGFPSEHTLLSVAVAGVIFIHRLKLGFILGIMGIGIGVCRVLAGVHHPIDITASVGIAVISVFISWIILKKIEESSYKIFLAKLFPSARRKGNWDSRD